MDEERRQRLVKLGSAVAFLAIAAVLVAVVISQSQSEGGDASDVKDVALVSNQLRGIPQKGMVLGDPDARVALVEFGDLQCPACKGYAEGIIPEVIAGPVRRGEAKLDFRNYVILGSESTDAGAGAIAAGEQGRGWNFVELFYRNQGFENSGYVTDDFLTAIARGAGVPDIAQWNADRRSKAVLREVNRTTSQASSLGFTGTPSFAVQGSDGALEPIGTPGSASEIESALSQAG
ncbi:MAG TPA: thioredoxin domain-containing protein [Solirubrobacterales bacterium]|nr:thioredoxin domain-containing protein [Solirubrobacterales bacterium]